MARGIEDMTNIFLAGVIYFSAIGTAIGADASSQEPILDAKDKQVVEHIGAAEREGELTKGEAARLQVRRSGIIGEARDLRDRNHGILPTADLARLSEALDSLDQLVQRRTKNQQIVIR